MIFEYLPVGLKPLITSSEDISYLIHLCDRYYAKCESARNWRCQYVRIERDLELVRVRFRGQKTYREIGIQFGLTPERVRQIVEKYLCGFRHPKVIRALREYKAATKIGKMKTWNKRVAEITEITGD